MKRTLTIGLAIILISAPIVTYFLSPDISEINHDIVVESNLSSIDPIRINSDDDLESLSKTMDWPVEMEGDSAYVFEGIFIDGSSHGYCIYIGNTTKTIIIKNCSFQNSQSDVSSFPNNAAIILYKARNVIIDDNSISNNHNGLYLKGSYYNTIVNNNIFSNTNGIEETEAGFNWIAENHIQSNTKHALIWTIQKVT